MRRSLFSVAFLLAFACTRTDNLTPTVAKLATSPLLPAAERELAERFFNETVSYHGGYVAMSMNAGSQRSSMRRYTLGLEVFQANLRVPAQPDPAGVERALRILSAKLSTPVLTQSASPLPPARRRRPPEVPEGTGIELDEDDVRGVVQVSLTLRVAPTDELVRKIATESVALSRLVAWNKAEAVVANGAPALLLTGEAYWFFPDVVVPKVIHRPKDFDAELGRLGLSGAPTDNTAKDHVEKSRKLFAEMASKRNDYEQVLELVRETVIKRAQFRFLRGRRALQDTRVKELKLSVAP